MRILSPIDNLSEVGALVEAGADELYGGFVSPGWVKKYSLLGSANQRYFSSAQFATEDDLASAVKAAHDLSASFFLTLNAPCYTPAQYDDLLIEIRRYMGMGVDAFIVADVGLMLRVRDALPGAALHLSALSSVFNSATAELLGGLGITRMVLPRELTLNEVTRLLKSNPNVLFDAFVMVGKCPNIEGFCTFTHNSPSLVWPCEERYDISVVKGGPEAVEIAGCQSLWSTVNRRQACGLCAIPALEKAGVYALKLVGRGGPTKMKVRAIRAVKDAVKMASERVDGDGYRAACRSVYRDVYGSDCNIHICCYPELGALRG